MTSTLIRDRLTPKEAFKLCASFDVHVDDEWGLQKMIVESLNTMYSVHKKVANVLQHHYAIVLVSYTTSWFKKVEQKVQLQYLNFSNNLEELVNSV